MDGSSSAVKLVVIETGVCLYTGLYSNHQTLAYVLFTFGVGRSAIYCIKRIARSSVLGPFPFLSTCWTLVFRYCMLYKLMNGTISNQRRLYLRTFTAE